MTKTCMQCSQYMYCSGKRPGGLGCLKVAKPGKVKAKKVIDDGMGEKRKGLKNPVCYLVRR